MPTWLSRLASILELAAIGFGALALLGLLVAALNGITEPSADHVLNLGVMVALILWLGRFSVFGYLGARGARRAGAWWLAVPAAALAVVGVALAGRAVALVDGAAPAAAGGVAALVADLPLLDWVIATAVAVPAAAIGPRIRSLEPGRRSIPLTAAGGVLAVAVAAVFIAPLADRLLEARGRRAVGASAVRAGAGDRQLEGLLQVMADRQAEYRRTRSTFAGDVSVLGLEVPTDVTVRLHEAGPDGWAAVAVRAGDGKAGCAVWSGRVTRSPTTPGGRPVPRDRVVCDP